MCFYSRSIFTIKIIIWIPNAVIHLLLTAHKLHEFLSKSYIQLKNAWKVNSICYNDTQHDSLKLACIRWHKTFTISKVTLILIYTVVLVSILWLIASPELKLFVVNKVSWLFVGSIFGRLALTSPCQVLLLLFISRMWKL